MTITCLINGEHYDRFYNDTIEPATTPLSVEAEKAFRAAFLAGAREAAEWESPNVEAVAAAREAREKARHQAEVIVTSSQLFNAPSFDDFDPPGTHYVYRLGHEIEASRTRGRHHAMEFCLRDWQELTDLGLGNNEEIRREFMRPWVSAVAFWIGDDPNGLWAPPRPIERFTPAQWQAVLSKQLGRERVIGNLQNVEPQLRPNEGVLLHSWDCHNLTGDILGRVYRWWHPLGNTARLAIRRGDRWVVYGGAAEKTMTQPSPVLTRRLDTVTREQLEWLWPGRIPLGKLTLLAGDPGLGKSFVTLDMAARVSTGASWPDTPILKQTAGGVILLNAEDDLVVCPV